MTNFKFMFLLKVFLNIYRHTEVLFTILQARTLDLRKSNHQMDATIAAIKSLRSQTKFQEIYEDTTTTIGHEDPSRIRCRKGWQDYEEGLSHEQHSSDSRGASDSYRILYYKIVDGIITQMTERLSDMQNLQFFRLLDPAAFTDFAKTNGFPATELAKLLDVYPFFDVHRLKNELLLVYENTTILSLQLRPCKA